VNWGNSFENITLDIENNCGTEKIWYEVLEAGQYPFPDIFEPHPIPGVIETVEYDYGGEGISYHDITPGNEGPGPRQENNVDTENNDNGNPNVGWIDSGEWLEYTVTVDSSSYYEVSMRVATNNASGGPFSILFNDEEKLNGIHVANTGGWASFNTINAGTVYLSEQDSLMRLNFNNGGFNLGSITFTPTDKPSSIDLTRLNNELRIYPVPATESVQVMSEMVISGYSLYDMNGRKMAHSQTVNMNEFQININKYPQGIYLLLTRTRNGNLQVGKVVKK